MPTKPELLCSECGEAAGYSYPIHSECCSHERVESEDFGDGDGQDAPIHDYHSFCLDCGREVMPDTEGGWELV